MRRFLVTLIVVVTLAVTFRVYSAVLDPLTEIRESHHPLVELMEADLRTPAVFEKQAVEIFPEYEWTHRAEQTWQMAEKAYVYFNKYERVQTSGNSIQIAPVAIFWHDPKRPGEKPFRILAERAQIKFQNAFFDRAIALSNANPGRIVWASLEGPVHIDGPDGLVIDGKNFKFDEESTQLYSDHEIKFSYGPTPQDQRIIHGTADQLQLLFSESHDSILGKDMPRVGELAQVLLRRNVALDLSFVQQEEQRAAQIRSAGSLQYDVLRREITLDDHVQVVHIADPQGTPRKDSIDCAWLQIQLDSTAPTDEKSESPHGAAFDGLTFRSLRAQGSENGHGSRLKVTSDDQQLVATMQDLAYDSTRRRAVLIDQKQVEIHRGNTRFVCPQIGLQHSVDNQIEYLECRGAGQMDVIPERAGDPPVVARWAGRVQVQPDPAAQVHRIQLEEQALLGVPGQFGIAADTIFLWVDLKRAQNMSGPSSTPSRTEPGGPANLLANTLPLKRARAENNVLLDSLLLKVERSQLIEMVIHPGLIDDPSKNTPAGGSSSTSPRSTPRPEDRPWIVEADSLHVDLIHDSGKAALDVREIIGAGKVTVQHDAGPAPRMANQPVNGPLKLQGESLLVKNQGGLHQLLTVRGELGPQGDVVQNASVSMGASTLWGGQITLARDENRVDVPGPGGFSVPLTQGLNGQAAKGDGNGKLDVVWQEGMSFDGLVARFWGKVTAAVPGEQKSITRLLCEDLSATLNHRISFADPNQQPPDLTISEIEARHHVVVESIEYALNQLAAVRNSTLAAFKVNLETGNFQGDGPGVIDSWSMGNAMKFSPGESPQANQPAKPSDTRWRYSSVRFAGRIDGNINRNDATLRERVEVLTAPVEKAKTKFLREQLSEASSEAANAVWMKCHQMRIIQKPLPGKAEKTFEVYATGGTELEGHVFRAVADELTYDEQYGLFTLRGLGKEAHLYHQQQAGGPVNPFSASQIKFVPVKREIVIDGSSGISGSY